MPKVWFITGTSKGFGRIWAEAALARGDRVAATARDPAHAGRAGRALRRQRPRPGASTSPTRPPSTPTVAQAHEHFGRLDVVVNNAGYGLFGTIEEVSEEQARAQIETNLFGALWVTKAALPILREQGSGHIIQVSSIGGVNAFPTVGLYHASKWGLEGFSQALAQEVAEFGDQGHDRRAHRLLAPTGRGPSGVRAERLARLRRRCGGAARRCAPSAPVGDPEATGPAILELVDAEEPPLRVFFGDGPLEA